MRQGLWGHLIVGAWVLSPHGTMLEVIGVNAANPGEVRLRGQDGSVAQVQRPMSAPATYQLPAPAEAVQVVIDALAGEIVVDRVVGEANLRAHLGTAHGVIASTTLHYPQVQAFHRALHEQRVYVYAHTHEAAPSVSVNEEASR